MRKLIDAAGTFLRETIWLERRSARRLVNFSTRLLRVCVLVGKGFYDDKCFLRASGLAFTTLLSLVPLLAFGFSILKGLGAEELVSDFVMERLTADRQEVADRVIEYVGKTDVKALGAFGLVLLLYTVVKVLSTIEVSFNDIWGLSQGRAWLRKITDYTSVVVIAPVLLAAAVGFSAYIATNPLARLGVNVTIGQYLARAGAKLGPSLLTWFAFTALYAFMPNTRVRSGAALVGGLVGGTLWQIAFWGYTTFQVGMARYDLIYGSFAALPIFLVWLYISWVVTLFGAEVAFAYEHVETYRRRLQHFNPSPAARERIALRVFLEIAKAFHEGSPPPDPERLGRTVRVPVRPSTTFWVFSAIAGLYPRSKPKPDRPTSREENSPASPPETFWQPSATTATRSRRPSPTPSGKTPSSLPAASRGD